MSLPAIDYLDWIEGRPESVEHDLGSSDLRGAAARDPDVVVPERLADLPDPDPDPDGVTVREAVAATYEVSPGNVLVTAGASLANAVAAVTALDRGLPVVPGRFFETPDRFRVSLGRDSVHVREALGVLGGVCDDL